VDAIDHLDLVVSDLEANLGIHHIAFTASSREAVGERARWCREQGAQIESGPREYDYTPGYYALFLHDPDGVKLEIVHR
jgi:glyoxylase I family protein